MQSYIKKILFFGFCLFIAQGSLAQKNMLRLLPNSPEIQNSPAQKNVVRLHAASLIALNASCSYERVLSPKLSAGLGFALMATPKLFSRPLLSNLEIGRISGISITPEIRFYTHRRSRPKTNSGFYIAPFMRYSGYKIPLDFSSNGLLPTTVQGKIYLHSYSAGLQFGYQWHIGKRLTIDWFGIGPKISRQTIGAKFNAQIDKQFLVAELRKYQTYDILNTGIVRRNIARIENFDTDRVLDAQKWFSTASIRTGIGIGIRF